MSKLKVAELFYSLQGEGRYMGIPSVFLRTFGCNFQCAGFGMPKGQLSVEADSVAEWMKKLESPENVEILSRTGTTQYPIRKYEDLPLVPTGCDSYASWHPAFKHLSPTMTTDEVADQIMKILPFGKWKDEHLVITGGEPLLGWQRAYPDLLNHPKMQRLKELTFETNGTQELTPDFRKYLDSWTAKKGKTALTFSVSAKLSCSGEPRAEAIQPKIVCEYQQYGYTYLKWVVATKEDADEALAMTELYRKEGFNGPVYLMGVGGTEDTFFKTNRQVAEFAMKNGLRYSDRMQVGLFRNAWGT